MKRDEYRTKVIKRLKARLFTVAAAGASSQKSIRC
jgi:hypothetical protein